MPAKVKKKTNIAKFYGFFCIYYSILDFAFQREG
jgi:hypothetical protein